MACNFGQAENNFNCRNQIEGLLKNKLSNIFEWYLRNGTI